MSTEGLKSSKEERPKEAVIFVICFNGRGRSKQIARALDELGYKKTRLLGVNSIHTLDNAAIKAIIEAQILVCASSDVKAQLQHWQGGLLTKGKVVLDLRMSENEHAIASGHMGTDQTTALKEKLKLKLSQLGF